jgi:hypothetical protein
MDAANKPSRAAHQAAGQLLDALHQSNCLTLAGLAIALNEASEGVSSGRAAQGKILAGQLQAFVESQKDMQAELGEVLQASEHAVDAILELAGNAQQLDGIPEPAVEMMGDIIQHCSFQDITGQRLKKIGHYLDRIAGKQDDAHSMRKAEAAKGLLDGPALAGGGLSQDDIDRMLDDM